MNKSTFGLLATVALVLSPVAAFAQSTAVNNQNASNSAAALGANNFVQQDILQQNLQTQVGVDGYYSPATPQLQISGQNAANAGVADGFGNVVDQSVYQTNDQFQGDVNGLVNPYLPY